MAEKHLVLCGGAKLTARTKAWREAPKVRVQLGNGKKHLHLKIHHITRKIGGGLPPEALDLIEIAAYVYAADQLITRGGTKEFEYGQKWRRHFRLEIPVRRHDLWSRPDVQQKLVSTLGFLSDDDYEFGFTKLVKNQPVERYLFDDQGADDAGFEEVILFSGGLDSFGGAVQEILQGQRKVVLVSHRSVSKLYKRQRDLVSDINRKFNDRSRKPLHVAVEVNKGKDFGRDFTQRSRSFLFAALAAVVARGFNRDRIRFYENGVISLNFPISPQALGGRATRTTHPQVLTGFQELFSLVFGIPFIVENPFLWKTKADILREIKAAGVSQLCARTSSCTHTLAQTKMHTHCGVCSQCVDRRLNALAADFDNEDDPREMYASDVITGARDGADLTMIERYVGTALEIERLTTAESFMMRFPEASRLIRHLGMTANDAAEAVFDLYRRHAREICHTLTKIVSADAASVVKQIHPVNCLLSVAVGRHAGIAQPNNATAASPSGETDGHLQIVRDTFTVHYKGKPCELRNTREFHLLERLNRSPGIYISNSVLGSDVWNDDQTEKNTIQRTVSNLRRRLRTAQFEGIDLDGTTNRDHYALKLP